jgi:hypothetical protein
VKTRVLLIIGAVLLIAGFAAIACSSDTGELEDRVAALEQQVSDDRQALTLAIQRTAIVSALNAFSAAGLHAMNESIDGGAIPAGAAGGVDSAIVAMASVDWPEELKADADALAASFQQLAEAIDAGDAAAAAPISSDTHEAWHEFSHMAAQFVSQAAGLGPHEKIGD